MAKKREMVCCILCGRDTAAQSAVCAKCAGGGAGSEQIGRKMVTGNFDASPMDEVDEGRDSHGSSYHGDTIRDDI